LTGGSIVWAGIVLMSHLDDLGIKDPLHILGNLYDISRYPGPASAGALLALVIRHGWHLGAVAAVSAAALGWGLLGLGLLRIRWPDASLRPLLGLGIGFAFLGLAMLGGGLAGLWFPVWPVLLSASGLWLLSRDRAALRALRPPSPGDWAIWPLAVLAAVTVALWIAVALAPEVFYDSLVYHLADPVSWVKAHKVVALPYNFFSNFPFTFEMLFAIGVLWGHDAVARLLHVSISLSAAGLIGWIAAYLCGDATEPRRRVAAGWIAALLYLTTPLIGSMAWMTGIDAGLVLYESATILCFILWWQSRPVSSSSIPLPSQCLPLLSPFLPLRHGSSFPRSSPAWGWG